MSKTVWCLSVCLLCLASCANDGTAIASLRSELSVLQQDVTDLQAQNRDLSTRLEAAEHWISAHPSAAPTAVAASPEAAPTQAVAAPPTPEATPAGEALPSTVAPEPGSLRVNPAILELRREILQQQIQLPQR